jgi:glycosyltransferase involved in cell wall biosynthesis
MRILYVEPFEAGSHAAFTKVLTEGIDAEWTVLTLPGRHWKWRMRGAAPYFALAHADVLAREVDLLVASSYLALSDLVGLVPSLASTPRVLYFHENQLAFPVREAFTGERDSHFGFTQLTSALAATRCVFNSRYNLESFLSEGERLLSKMPDAVAAGWIERIRARSSVISVPLELPDLDDSGYAPTPRDRRAEGPIIVWNHRWEHDKNPEAFFDALDALRRRSVPFRVAVCGQRFREAPAVFEQARMSLGSRVVHWGYADNRADYHALLGGAHIAVSTSVHEFFGISMLETTHFGARPLVPNRLSYVELFGPEFRFEDEELVDELERLCRGWVAGEFDLRRRRGDLVEPHRSPTVLEQFRLLFQAAAS